MASHGSLVFIKSVLVKIRNSTVDVVAFLFTKENYEAKLNKLGKEVSRRPLNNTPLKILVGPSFSVYPPVFTHDRLLSYSLRVKGAEIIPVYCDQVQKVECNVFGGAWGKKGDFKSSCNHCNKCSEKLWADSPIPAIRLSEYLSDTDRRNIEKMVADLQGDEWTTFVHNGLPFGYWAKDILVNNYTVGDHHLVPGHFDLGMSHLKNLLLLEIAYEKILDTVKPDRVISNDSYYGMWALMEKLSVRRKIPFYSHWGPMAKGIWIYASNDASLNMDFSKPWKKFSAIPLGDEQIEKVKNWLEKRVEGKELLIDTASLSNFKTDDFDLSTIDFKKPTALLTANVIWDLAALNKQVIFSDMINWIAETILWFTDHPEYQLIVKPHPAELHPSIPETEERVEIALQRKGIRIPSNVFLFSPKVKLTIYELLPLIKVCLVHTTTVGIEAAAIGLPVITTARSPYRGFGFTIDPVNATGYFENIATMLTKGAVVDLVLQKELTYKFILFYQYHYFMRTERFSYAWGGELDLKVSTVKELEPGKNRAWDYVVDSILSGSEIVSEDHWMPES